MLLTLFRGLMILVGMDVVGCLGCDPLAGRRDPPGGIIALTTSWVVSHVVGPMNLGTLIVGPREHVVAVADLDEDAAARNSAPSCVNRGSVNGPVRCSAPGGVVRVGDTVRRPAGPWTPAVHALLTHLHSAGFGAAPRPLGIDERGREILTFIHGAPAWPDGFRLLDGNERLAQATRLIREFHDAVATFIPPPDPHWQVLIPADGSEIIAHHDLAPWNLIIGGPQWAFIDWDLAAPGTRLWDLAYAIHGFVPLTANPGYQRQDTSRRLRLMADTYGLSQQQRLDIIPLLARRTAAQHAFLAREAARGTEPWTRLWHEGHGDAWRADTDYIVQHGTQWRQALLG
jgi:Phosphotransferase enzyme family